MSEDKATLEVLARRAIGCKHWRWMEGMRALRRGIECGVRVGACEYAEDGCFPDLSDPATMGCILALVREAWGSPMIVTMPMARGQWGVAIPTVLRDGTRFCSETEAAALVAALEKVP